MKLFRYILACLVCGTALLVSNNHLWATHMWGGDITYKCMGNNVFQFTLTLYQDCLNGEPLAIEADNPAQYAIYYSGPNPVLVSSGAIQATDSTSIPPNFSNQCINNFPNTCLRRERFVFNVTLPPDSTGYGYDIVYQRCCRNATINNILNPGNVGVTYHSHIPAFTAGQCPNNSAIFKNMPPQIICAADPLVYDFSATDADGDSLSYELCYASPGGTVNNSIPSGSQISPPPFQSVSYAAPFDYTYPMAASPALAIDAVSGLMTGQPAGTGRYVVTVCCHEWRNGAIINTLSRDVQFVVTNCSKAVVANIPQLSEQANTFIVECSSYTVNFINTSTGGFSYLWNFGVNNATSTQFEPSFTYPDTGVYSVKLVVNPGSTCQDSITRLVKIYPYFNVDFSFSGQLCPGNPISFKDSIVTTYKPTTSLLWNFGDGNTSSLSDPSHIFDGYGGDYNVKLVAENGMGCKDSTTKTVSIPYFHLNAGNDTVIVLGNSFNMHASGASYYTWSPSNYLADVNSPTTAVNFPDTGYYTYYLHGTNEAGCEANDTINIRVVDKPLFVFPNAFSPNGDGVNDLFRPVIIGYKGINYLKVFNRWGQMIYATSEASVGWNGTFNGKPVDIGTYFWTAQGVDADNKTVDLKGDVTLIR